MNLDKSIEKAKQTAALLRSDIGQAYKAAALIQRSEPSASDRALVAYLMETLEMVSKLEIKLGAL